jgi:hypothetical protein
VDDAGSALNGQFGIRLNFRDPKSSCVVVTSSHLTLERIKEMPTRVDHPPMTQALPDLPRQFPGSDRMSAKCRDTRWLGVGHADPRTSRPGATATFYALAGRTDTRLVIVFVSSDVDVQAVVTEVCDLLPSDVPVVGCTTAGEIGTTGPSDRSVVVVALGGDGFTVAVSLARNASANLRRAGATAAQAMSRLEPREHKTLLLLTDGLAGDQQEIVRGAYGVVGAEVPLVGGCAGDDMRMAATHVVFGDEVLTDGVVGVALGSTHPMGIGVQHGWRRVGDAMLVTASDGGRVFTLDDEPALDVYLRALGAPPEAATDPAAFTRFALTHPLGLNRRTGEEVRFISGADFTDRSLTCIAQVPQGGFAWIMEGDDESVLAATDAACSDALVPLDGREPLGLLAFDCIARRGVLGDGISHEVRRIAESAPGTPVAGFYTYGEIARTRGVGGFHNQTLVVLAVG